MAFWCRINRFKLKHLPNQIVQRYYLGNSNASHTNPCVAEKPYWVIHSGPVSFCNNVRFFAAPVQAAKKEKRDTSGPRLNGQIQAPYVRLVAEEGLKEYFKFEDGKTVVVSRQEALECGRKLKLDLVEVQRTANPPVCKLMDYHREKYKKQLKEKDRAKSKSEVSLRKGDCKEVRFSGKTELKDLKMKADQIKRLMERGYRVKCRAMGKEDQDLGGLLSRVSALIEDVCIVESGPLVRETEAHVVVRHVKFGMPKKGGGKKLKVVGDTRAKVATTVPEAVNSIDSTEELSSAEYDSETEEEILSEEVDLPIPSSMEIPDESFGDKKNAWSVVDAGDNFEEVFRLGDDVNGVTSSLDKQLKTAQETASPSSNVNVSDFLHSMEVPKFTRADLVPSSPFSPQGPSTGTEKIHKGSEPRNQFPPTKPIDNSGPGMRDSVRLESQFPNLRRQTPVDVNFSPSGAESRQVGTDTTVFRNSKLPPNNMPKQGPSLGAPTTPAPSYGIFSSPTTPRGQGVPAEVRRSREGNPHDAARNPGTIGVSPNENLPNLNSDDSQRPGPDKGGQKAWGVFSRGSSNTMPNMTSKPN
ncbi:translation initiation factor IF3-1, mitochondrial [Quercus suber]|uniref:translation initiation factor IF3-1, mitochondrial n=1 Tax=Quercus suber TaxID=58331 RepID=UPI000CE1C27B|nr:translation initiation factor IF3-1, mitochondrial [Quercus suber]